MRQSLDRRHVAKSLDRGLRTVPQTIRQTERLFQDWPRNLFHSKSLHRSWFALKYEAVLTRYFAPCVFHAYLLVKVNVMSVRLTSRNGMAALREMHPDNVDRPVNVEVTNSVTERRDDTLS
jgi:hypothetical protein